MSVSLLCLLLPVASMDAVAPPVAPPELHAAASTEATAPSPSVNAEPTPPAPSSLPAPASPPSASPAPSAAAGVGQSDIVVSARQPIAADPIESVNVASFKAVQAVDLAFVAPVSRVYRGGVPRPIRDGVHNAINNLDEPIVFVNFLLQHNIGKAAETAARFLINSTVGIAGLFDIAKRKPINLPRRGNGLADTLGFYGIGPGPYLFLPIVGSTTVRDLIGRVADLSLLPATVGKPFSDPTFSLAKGVLSALDYRVRNDDKITRLRDESADGYATMRDVYLRDRQAHIDALKGKGRDPELDGAVPPPRLQPAAPPPAPPAPQIPEASPQQ